MDVPPPENVDLLHPFYLDTDMSMAFAAALTGGVALETEKIEHEAQESEALKNLRGNLRIFDAIGFGGGKELKEGEAGSTESRLKREHTKASIFIGLHDELRRTGRVREASIDAMEPGQLVSLDIGPAVAPLRRIVDQVLRLLDVLVPFTGGEQGSGEEAQKLTRQQRRQQAREAAKATVDSESDDQNGLNLMRQIFIALQDDLERSGMVDVVVQRDNAPNVILTLDERFISDQALELLHTSKFTVIGKVTQVWPAEDEFVNLYRRSVLSLVPALVQTVSMGMLRFLIGLAEGAQSADLLGDLNTEPSEVQGTEERQGYEGDSSEENDAEGIQSNEDGPDGEEPVISQEAFKAVLPGVESPAFQLLPLAICT